MKVITFNIRCGDDDNGHSVIERAPRLKVILDKYDADVIGFQEVTPEWLEIIEKDYSDEYYIFNQYRSKDYAVEAETVMWKKQKFTFVDKGYFWFSKTPWVESLGDDALYHCKRICEWAILCDKETDKEFCYFNLHFGFGDDYQVESARLIKSTADIIGVKNVIITGDFNMQPTSPAYAEMTSHYADVNQLTAKYEGTTYHNYGKVKNGHIDYCFISESVRAEKYQLIDDLIDGKYPSDHYGILFELELN